MAKHTSSESWRRWWGEKLRVGGGFEGLGEEGWKAKTKHSVMGCKSFQVSTERHYLPPPPHPPPSGGGGGGEDDEELALIIPDKKGGEGFGGEEATRGAR